MRCSGHRLINLHISFYNIGLDEVIVSEPLLLHRCLGFYLGWLFLWCLVSYLRLLLSEPVDDLTIGLGRLVSVEYEIRNILSYESSTFILAKRLSYRW